MSAFSNFATWAIDQLFGAGTAENFPAFIKSATAKVMAANPGMQLPDVQGLVVTDFNAMVSALASKARINSFAVGFVETFADQALAGLISQAYAEYVPAAAPAEVQEPNPNASEPAAETPSA